MLAVGRTSVLDGDWTHVPVVHNNAAFDYSIDLDAFKVFVYVVLSFEILSLRAPCQQIVHFCVQYSSHSRGSVVFANPYTETLAR